MFIMQLTALESLRKRAEENAQIAQDRISQGLEALQNKERELGSPEPDFGELHLILSRSKAISEQINVDSIDLETVYRSNDYKYLAKEYDNGIAQISASEIKYREELDELSSKLALK